MNFSFISLVSVVNSREDADQVEQYLPNLHDLLASNFNDFEIIIVNNSLVTDLLNGKLQHHDSNKHHRYIINLSRQIDENNAVVAGLDQANGDYVLFLEPEFFETPGVILQMVQMAQQNYDIVYLSSAQKTTGWIRKILLGTFYFLMRRYSGLRVDPHAYNSRIISRRAINSILKLRENMRYMKAIYSLVGYRTASVDVAPPANKTPAKFLDELKMSVIALTSFTNLLGVMLMWIFISSIVLFIGVSTNAVMVKLLGKDIFGHPQSEVTGWAFLVILISLTFAILCLILYIMSIYLSNIYREIKQRPLYIIESIRRL
jgi:glycosyltransferase involved in cell wall biosynthesis